MRPFFVVLLFAPFSAGCTTVALSNASLKQIASVTDLRYQEVVDNLAVVAANADTLPSLMVVADGQASLVDTLSFDAKTMWTQAMFKGFSSQSLNPAFSRNPQPYWTLAPMVDLQKLEASWHAMRWALGHHPEPSDPGTKVLRLFQLGNKLSLLPPPGWVHVGCLKDVPHSTAYKSHCQNTWVWVNPEDMEALSTLTLVVLDIGTVDVTSLKSPDDGPNAKVKVVISDKEKDKKDKDKELFSNTIELDSQQAVQLSDKTIKVNLDGFSSLAAPKSLPESVIFNPLDLSSRPSDGGKGSINSEPKQKSMKPN